MKRTVCLTFAALFMAGTVHAQAPAAQPQTLGLAVSFQRAYAGIKQNLTEAADKMAEADYQYRPTPEVRPYSGQFGHVATFHYLWCSAVKGEANPKQGQDLEKTTAKADVVKMLADSFTYCDAAFASLTDESALQLVKQGNNQVARGAILANLIAHDNEEYGVTGVYLRTKALVPPSTERAMRGRGMPMPMPAPQGR